MFKRIHLFFLVVIFLSMAANLHAAENSPITAKEKINRVELEKGIAEFKAENYEEAIIFFEKSYKENPADAQTTLYLGLTHREMQDFSEAVRFFKETLALDSNASEVQFLLADVLYNMARYEEALSVIETAINSGVKLPQSNYLKGLISLKLKRNTEALEAFRNAKTLDPALRQEADFQIAAAYLQEKNYKKAELTFRGLITVDPGSDWALFSKDYLEALEKIQPAYKLNASFGMQYDDNVLAVPIIQSLVDVTKQEDWKKIYSLLGEYNLYSRGAWNLRSSYAVNITQYDKSNYPKTTAGQQVFSQDMISHTVSLMPSYNTEKTVGSLLFSYSYLEVDYSKYMQTFTVSPSCTSVIKKDHLSQVFLKYKRQEHNTEFLKSKLGSYASREEDRDATYFSLGLGYFYILKENAILNIKVEGDINDADGANWDYTGVKTSVGLLYPFFKNRLKANFFLETYHQDFSNVHTTYGKERRDDTVMAQTFLTYSVMKPMDISVGYAHIKDDSNINVYEYRRNLYTVNIEYRF